MRFLPRLVSLSVLIASGNGLAHAQILPRWRAKALHSIPTDMTGTVPGLIRVKYAPDYAVEVERKALSRKLVVSGLQEEFVRRIPDSGWIEWKIPLVMNTTTVARSLIGKPNVICAEPVNKIYPLGGLPDPNDPDFSYTETDPTLILDLNDSSPSFRRLWNLDDINAMEGWAIYPGYWMTATKKPTNRPLVAIIDTGCDMDHPDFINAGGKGTDVSLGGQFVKSLSYYFNDGIPVKNPTPDDMNGHGTHVTGIALAAGNNGAFSNSVSNGVIGMGYNAKGMILRVFDNQGNGSDTDAAAAIRFAADKGADIINLSLGTGNYSQLFQDAVTYAFEKGSAVFAAGNESGSGGGPMGPIYPAACSGACAVAAAGPGGSIATAYAGSGNYLDVAGPGGNVSYAADLSSYSIQYVWSTAMRTPGELNALSASGALFPNYDVNYAYLAGTSMACPHVSGAAALYYGKNNLNQALGWSNVKVYRALEQSAQGIGAPHGGWETNFGYGLIDLQALLLNQNQRAATIGSIQGRVYYNGNAVSNIAVKATINKKTYTTTTQSDGGYRFDSLPAGTATMSATAYGANKTKNTTVYVGADTPGIDFWCGTFPVDKTPPVISRVSVYGTHGPKYMSVGYWSYDTETGIDRIVLQIGTLPGKADVVLPVEVSSYANAATMTGNFVTGKTYYVTAISNNGNGLQTRKTTSVVW